MAGVFVAGATPAVADHVEEVTVDGTVTGIDDGPAGDAVVLVGEDSTLTRFSPDELRDIATDDPRNPTVVEVGRDGRFDATLVLTVPDGTPVGEYPVELCAESDTPLVSAGPETVEYVRQTR